MKIDELNIAIIRHLREGRKSLKAIAEDLGVSENTVRSRVAKLEDEGVLGNIRTSLTPRPFPGTGW